MKNRWIFVFSVCLALPLSVYSTAIPIYTSWQTVEKSYNNAFFKFKMPAVPKEEQVSGRTYWRTSFDHSRFIFGAKPRECTHDGQPLERGDIDAFIRDKISPKGFVLAEESRDADGKWHMTFVHTKKNRNFLLSAVAKNNLVFVLITRTKDNSLHERFIESLTFLDPPAKPPCCACCAKKGTNCS